MRRHAFIIALALLLVSALSIAADEAVLIDFSLLAADILPLKDKDQKVIPDKNGNEQPMENRATMMDFSSTAGGTYTKEQMEQMRISLAIRNWDVILSSSSRSILNQSLSMTREAKVDQNAKQFGGKTVMGIRVHFPNEGFNSWARIKPPFEIPAFAPKADIDDTGAITVKTDQQGTDPANARLTRFEGTSDGKVTTALGIVKNVGVIKSVAVMVKGLNYPHGLSLVLKDSDGNEKVLFMGYLNFDGWKELRWDNPQYVSDVRNRELKIYPLYPKSTPFVKFDGFLLTRDGSAIGGDFITYIKDVKILYDKAVLEPVRDIDDEDIWGVVAQKEAERQQLEARSFGSQQVMRYLERMKQETADFSKPETQP
jgi:hypothetical protein